MKIGAHVSIAGGVHNAPKNAHALGCETYQIFTRPPQGGPAPLLTPSIIKQFQEENKKYGFTEWVVHTPYFINLASKNPRIRFGSATVIREDLERANVLDASVIMTHLGSGRDVSQEEAMMFVIQGLQKVLDGYQGKTKLLVELSAGAGMVIGDTFEELAAILHALDDRCGICFDTQHAFASGYDLRTPKSVKKTFDAFAAIIGMEHLHLIHANDSLVTLEGHRDRHEHIGSGIIAYQGFQALMNEPRLKNVNLILETKPDRMAEDIQILQKLRDNPSALP